MGEYRIRPGGKIQWGSKNPRILSAMERHGLTAYELAHILGMHPDSLGRKMRYASLSEEETNLYIQKIEDYFQNQSFEDHG